MLTQRSDTYGIFDVLHCFIPIATAAVDRHTYTPDEDVLDMRVMTLALYTIGTIAASFTVALTIFPPTILISVIVIPAFFGIMTYDRRLAEQVSDSLAVDHYIKHDTPSINCIDRILKNVSAVKLLLTKTKDITKTTTSKYKILDPAHLKKDVFELLVDNEIDVFSKDEDGIPFIVDFEDPSFLEYALKKNQEITSRLSDEEKILYFQHVRNLRSIKTLVDAGFDINTKDRKGYTPILSCILSTNTIPGIMDSNKGTQYYDKVIETLLENGADPDIGVVINGIQYDAEHLNSNPSIDTILKKHKCLRNSSRDTHAI